MGNYVNACCTSDANKEKQLRFENTPKHEPTRAHTFGDPGPTSVKPAPGTGGTRPESSPGSIAVN